MTLLAAHALLGGCVLFAVYWAWTWVRDQLRDNRRRELAWRKRVSEAAQAARDRIAAQAATPEPRPEPAWQPPPRPRPRPTPPPPPPWPPPPPDAASADAKAQQKIAALEALARSTTSDGERQAAMNAAALLRETHPPAAAPPRHVSVTAQAWDFGRGDRDPFNRAPGSRLTPEQRESLDAALAGLAAATAAAVASVTMASMARQRRGQKARRR